MNKKKYSDFLMVDHNLQSLKFCDKAIVIHKGSVIEFTKVEEAISTHLKLMKNKG